MTCCQYVSLHEKLLVKGSTHTNFGASAKLFKLSYEFRVYFGGRRPPLDVTLTIKDIAIVRKRAEEKFIFTTNSIEHGFGGSL